MPHVKDFEFIYNRLRTDGYVAENVGELNAYITAMCKNYLLAGKLNYNYARINDILGALSGATLEFYRLAAAPHEDIKRKENGDAWKL